MRASSSSPAALLEMADVFYQSRDSPNRDPRYKMADQKLRKRVERLLCGDIRPQDIMTLFLFARDHCDGREVVADIGHFTAHHLDRDRGITVRSAREWCLQMRVHIPFFESEPRKVDIGRLPPATRDYLKIAASRIGPTNFEKHAGLSMKVAHKSLCSLAERLLLNADGTWRIPRDTTQNEHAALKCVLSLIVAKPAFEPQLLASGFLDTLRSNGLLTKEEARQHRSRLSSLVQLFAVSVMHRTKVIMEDDASLPIYARTNIDQKRIELLCEVTVPFRGKELGMVSAIFAAELDPREHCHPDLLANGGAMQSDLELSAEGKLVPL